MSEDGLSDSFEYADMEIQIETLMGGSFGMSVTSSDTIADIKHRIERVEGIPVSHQNLIFQSKELKDTRQLSEVGVTDGSTIKLVLSMRGGPISTRRITTACEHHMMLKELKDLLENTRDEIGEKLAPGSKVSVLVFKEGDIINLLRVIENEDGSYSPYHNNNDKSSSPPSKSSRLEYRQIFDKLVEDHKMMTNVTSLKKKMEGVNARKQATKQRSDEDEAMSSTDGVVVDIEDDYTSRLFGDSGEFSYNLLGECGESEILENLDLKIFEKKGVEISESEEVALKDKHRTKSKTRAPPPTTKSVFSETKGAFSHTKHNYTRLHRKSKESDAEEIKVEEDLCSASILSPICDENQEVALAAGGPNALHVARLVIDNDRPKTTPAIEVAEGGASAQSGAFRSADLHEPSAKCQRVKHSARACKVGVLKRRQSIDYSIEPNSGQDLNFNNYCKNSEFEVCSSNVYHRMPPFVSSQSAIPPEYAPKDPEICKYYFRKGGNPGSARSPLYNRNVDLNFTEEEANNETNQEFGGKNSILKLPEIKPDKYNYLNEFSNIQRLKNDCVENASSNTFDDDEEEIFNEFYNYCNLSRPNLREDGAAKIGFLNHPKGSGGGTILDKDYLELPPVIKKKARCNLCNKRLNITTIYNCRCGKIFCSQHRYSEVHGCTYDYKKEGRKFLEQQNPLVTADKINRI